MFIAPYWPMLLDANNRLILICILQSFKKKQKKNFSMISQSDNIYLHCLIPSSVVLLQLLLYLVFSLWNNVSLAKSVTELHMLHTYASGETHSNLLEVNCQLNSSKAQ